MVQILKRVREQQLSVKKQLMYMYMCEPHIINIYILGNDFLLYASQLVYEVELYSKCVIAYLRCLIVHCCDDCTRGPIHITMCTHTPTHTHSCTQITCSHIRVHIIMNSHAHMQTHNYNKFTHLKTVVDSFRVPGKVSTPGRYTYHNYFNAI